MPEEFDNHRHTGTDSKIVEYTDLEDAIDEDELVKLTGAQTIAGVKTFSSIPVLPASDPATDNQAVRKSYVDDAIKTEVIGGTDVIDSAGTLRSTLETSYTKIKEIEFNEVDGDINVRFSLRAGATATAYGRIYVNGVAVGTERITSSTTLVFWDEDISVVTGDLVQLYLKKDGSNGAFTDDFQLRYEKVLTITAGTVNTD